jgi:hypothetical protein
MRRVQAKKLCICYSLTKKKVSVQSLLNMSNKQEKFFFFFV